MKVSALILLLLTVGLMAGCGGGGQTTGDAFPSAETPKPGESIGVPEGEK